MESPAVERERLIFIHIPKAAGNSLNQILHRLYPSEKTLSLYGTDDVANFYDLPQEQRDNFALLEGHFLYGLHKYLSQPARYRYITMLREPVDRIVSLYYFILRSPDIYLYEAVTSRNMSLLDFAKSDITPELYNFQTAALAGGDLLTIDTKNTGLAELERAKQHLRDDIDAFGLLDRFDASLILYNRFLGWRLRPKELVYSRRNVTAGRPSVHDISPEVRAHIRQINALDCELYEYAQGLFASRVRDMGRVCKTQLKRLKRAKKRVTSS